MQACAESPVPFLNQMLESINSNVQELKRSYLMRLPHAKPLCIGMGCKGRREDELLEEERASALWDWSGSTSGVQALLEDSRQSRKTHMDQQQLQESDALHLAKQEEVENRGYHAIAASAANDQDLQQQPKQKRQRKTDDLSGLDPSQALKDLMMRGPQSSAARSCDVNALLENQSSAGRGHHHDPAERMNGSDPIGPQHFGLQAPLSAPAGNTAEESHRQAEAVKNSLQEKLDNLIQKERSIRAQLHVDLNNLHQNPALRHYAGIPAVAQAEEVDNLTERLLKDQVQELQQEYKRMTGFDLEWVWSKAQQQQQQEQIQQQMQAQEQQVRLQMHQALLAAQKQHMDQKMTSRGHFQ